MQNSFFICISIHKIYKNILSNSKSEIKSNILNHQQYLAHNKDNLHLLNKSYMHTLKKTFGQHAGITTVNRNLAMCLIPH